MGWNGVNELRGDLECRRVEFDGVESVGLLVLCSNFVAECARDKLCVGELEISALMHLIYFNVCA